MTTWIESERDLEAWLDRRFPDDRTLDQRIDRSTRERLVVSLVPYAATWVGLHLVVPDGKRLLDTPGGNPPWTSAAWIAAVLLLVAGIAVGIRDRPRQSRSRVLDALTGRQRRELVAEIAGRRPVVPGDEPVLERFARGRRVRKHLVWATAAAVVALLPAEVADPGGATGVVRIVFMGVFVWIAADAWRDARQADRYLDRTARSA